MAQVLDRLPSAVDRPQVRDVDILRPFSWLRNGWRDIKRLGLSSLGYGALVTALCLLLLVLVQGVPHLVPAFIGGFLLAAPLLAIGLYAMSRQLEIHDHFDVKEAGAASWRNAGSLGLFGLLLALSLISWERLAAILFALFFGGTVPDLSHLVSDVVFSGRYQLLVIAFFGTGALVAAAVFAFSVVTAPLLFDRPVDVVTAAVTSLRCCARNPAAMLLWAALIAVLTAIGFATFMLGMVLLFPWLGHASWHAYRDLVE